MRESKIKFLERCEELCKVINVKSYKIEDYDEGCIAEFSIPKIKNLQKLVKAIGDADILLYGNDSSITISIREKI